MAILHNSRYHQARNRRYTFDQRVFIVDRMFSRLKAFDCRYTRLLGNMNADFGLTRARLRILDAVIRLPSNWNISDIARHLDLSRQTVHRTMRAMEKAGLIVLEPAGKKALVPRLASTGRIVSTLRLTQAHEWTQKLAWGIPTAIASTASWIAEQLNSNLPPRMVPDEIDPDNLPTGMPRGYWLEYNGRPRQSWLVPKHPIIENGDPLWPNDLKPARLQAGGRGYGARATAAR